MEATHEIELLVQSRHPLLAVETWEEDRLEHTLRQVANRLGLPFHAWSLTGGLTAAGGAGKIYDSEDPAKALLNLPSLVHEGLLLFKDLHHYLDRPEVVRKLLDLGDLMPTQRRTIVLAAPKLELPAALEKAVARFRLALPKEDELRRLVHDVVNGLARRQTVRVDLTDQEYRRLVGGLKGLTLFEAERAVTKAVLDDMALTAEDVEGVQRAKRELLAREGVVDYLPPRPDDPPLGGLERFKGWLKKRKGAFSPEAKAYGLPPPKGVILLGVQGCGKTLAARTVADGWGLPLLRLEPGQLYDKFIGESERNLDRALWLAEHMAPCVLLVDEIEKGFAGSDSSSTDGGLSRRILGRLLGWLQDRPAPVFVVATCNAVQDLPPELLRKGRFDEIFFVDLPDAAERRVIFSLHLSKRDRDPETFDLDRLAEASEGFSGAEIEQAIVSALYTAFGEGKEIDTAAVEAEIRTTRPLSVTRKEEIDSLRAWARERAVSAK